MATAAMKGRLAHKYYEAAEEAYALDPSEEQDDDIECFFFFTFSNPSDYFVFLSCFCYMQVSFKDAKFRT